MSKPSERKKARRKKRVAVREAKTVPDWLFDEEPGEPYLELAPRDVTDAILGVGNSLEDGRSDAVAELVRQAVRFEEQLLARGWTFDPEYSGHGSATWYWVPSEADIPGEDPCERFTSVSLMVSDEAHSDVRFPDAVHLFLVGCDRSGQLHYRLSPGQVPEHIETMESYRYDEPVPVFA